MMVSNCLIFAITLYVRRLGCGNPRKVCARRKRGSFLPHFMYQEFRRGVKRRVHYVPIAGGELTIAPLFRGWVKWGDRDLPPPDPVLADSVNSLREWARETGTPRDVFCVWTNYGVLAFFKQQIDAACTYHKLEMLLSERIDEARADQEMKAGRLAPCLTITKEEPNG